MTETKKLSADKLVAEILAGRHDEDLERLINTIGKRIETAESLALRWRIRFNGDEWTEESVPLAELQIVQRVTDTPWLRLRPLLNVEHLGAFIYAHLARNGTSADDARARVDALTQRELVDAIDEYVLTSAPKDDPATSTTP